MKVTIKGANLDGEQIGRLMDDMQDEFGEHGLRIKNMVCYIQFMDDALDVIEIEQNGNPIERVVVFTPDGSDYTQDTYEIKNAPSQD